MMKKQGRILMLALAGFAMTSTLAAQSASHALEGIWSFTVDPDPEGLPTYSNLRSFSKDGVAIAVDGSSGPLGAASTAVGMWQRTAGREFRFVMYAVLTRDGAQIGRQRLEGLVVVDATGKTLSGIGKTTTYDMTWKELFNGTARITGERLPLLDD
jgi:hypothetical protein